jgi:mannose-1-phosphate guanylyltransferase
MTAVRWCIVVADAAGPEWPLSDDINVARAPVQFCGLSGPTTMLQKALHRAARISHASRIIVTADERNRSHWQPALWFTRAEHRFVSDCPGWSSLTTAAAVLSIAARAPSTLITILPARSYVADEWTLTVALHRVLSNRSFLADDIVTLGMVVEQPGVEEDYLILGAPDGRPTVAVSATARRPAIWAARDLVRQGAVVASGIFVAYASALVAHLYRHWPALTRKIIRHVGRSLVVGAENSIPSSLAREELSAVLHVWDRPPWKPIRALPVAPCGWSSLRSARAIELIATPRQRNLQTVGTEAEYEF